MDYMKIRTSKAVIDAIWDEHGEAMCVFDTVSYPDGDPHGDMSVGRMDTSWGFGGAEHPVFMYRLTWQIANGMRLLGTDRYECWLCMASKGKG